MLKLVGTAMYIGGPILAGIYWYTVFSQAFVR